MPSVIITWDSVATEIKVSKGSGSLVNYLVRAAVIAAGIEACKDLALIHIHQLILSLVSIIIVASLGVVVRVDLSLSFNSHHTLTTDSFVIAWLITAMAN